MLLGQDFSWRHEGTLMPTLNSGQHCRYCNNRFTSAYVTLQQSMHRVRTCQVGFDFGDNSMLSLSQLIRQMLIKARNELSINFVLNSDGVAFD